MCGCGIIDTVCGIGIPIAGLANATAVNDISVVSLKPQTDTRFIGYSAALILNKDARDVRMANKTNAACKDCKRLGGSVPINHIVEMFALVERSVREGQVLVAKHKIKR
jgi:hypothetical protein